MHQLGRVLVPERRVHVASALVQTQSNRQGPYLHGHIDFIVVLFAFDHAQSLFEAGVRTHFLDLIHLPVIQYAVALAHRVVYVQLKLRDLFLRIHCNVNHLPREHVVDLLLGKVILSHCLFIQETVALLHRLVLIVCVLGNVTSSLLRYTRFLVLLRQWHFQIQGIALPYLHCVITGVVVMDYVSHRTTVQERRFESGESETVEEGRNGTLLEGLLTGG